MPLICAGTPLLRKSLNKSDREVCAAFCDAVDSAVKASAEIGDEALVPLSQRKPEVIRGEDVSTLVVLQREMGCVAPTEYNPVSKCAIQSRICSIDATTCAIVAFRDPYSGTTVMGHFDQGGAQVDDSVPAMLNYLPAKPVATAGLLTQAQREHVDELVEKYSAKRVVQLYIAGAFEFPQYSAETLSTILRHFADETDVVFDVVLGGVCVWSQNLKSKGRCIHHGIVIDSKTGVVAPAEIDEKRAYPAGRLRSLRCFDNEEKRLAGITLVPGETVSTSAPVDQQGVRKALQFVQIVRPFKFPSFSTIVARKPLEAFMSMSSSPDAEPKDFAEVFKSAVVYASLTSWEKVFPMQPNKGGVRSPVAFQLTIGDAAAAAAENDAAAEGAEEPASAATAQADGGSTAPAKRELMFEWTQISPMVPTNGSA